MNRFVLINKLSAYMVACLKQQQKREREREFKEDTE